MGLLVGVLGCAPSGPSARSQAPREDAVSASAGSTSREPHPPTRTEPGPDAAAPRLAAAKAGEGETAALPSSPAAVTIAKTIAPGGPAFEVTRRVRTGVQPKSIALSPDGSRLYVCNFGFSGRRNVWVYDAQTLEHVGRIDFPGNAAEAVVSPDGATVYVSNFARSLIEVVDAETLDVTDEITVGSNPKFMVIDEARNTLYVSNWSSKTVSAVDLDAGKVSRTLRTGRRPRGLALLADGTLLVGAMWDHRVQVYGPHDTEPSRQFDTCQNPRHLMLSPNEERLYVSCSGERLLRWFDPVTGEALGDSPTGRNPRTIDVSGDGRYVAIADFTSSTISVVDVEDMHHRTHPVPRTNQIVGLAVAPGSPLRVYATSWLTNELLELRPTDR